MRVWKCAYFLYIPFSQRLRIQRFANFENFANVMSVRLGGRFASYRPRFAKFESRNDKNEQISLSKLAKYTHSVKQTHTPGRFIFGSVFRCLFVQHLKYHTSNLRYFALFIFMKNLDFEV